MKILKIIFLLFVCLNLMAQPKAEIKTFLRDQFPNKTEKLIYTEHFFHDLEETKESIREHKILRKYDYNSRKVIDSIIFTNEEVDNVISQLEKNNNKRCWAKNSIKNAQFISRKEIDKIFKDKSKGWPYFHKTYGKCFTSFSKPVFVRNNTICFFYSGSGCGSLAGHGNFAVFVKKNGKWENFEMISFWIS